MMTEVENAILELKEHFKNNVFIVTEDNEGGALVIIEDVSFEERDHLYDQKSSWIGFRIHFQYPYSDIYPIFIRGDIKRKDNAPLGTGTSPTTFEGRPAIQLSRKSNKMCAETDTALLKVLKVMTWFLTKP